MKSTVTLQTGDELAVIPADDLRLGEYGVGVEGNYAGHVITRVTVYWGCAEHSGRLANLTAPDKFPGTATHVRRLRHPERVVITFPNDEG
jgi:hypothetical protein